MRRKLLIALAVLVAACWAWIALRPGPEEHLAALIAELRARGEPVSPADLERPLPPDEENGATDLDAAVAWFTEHEPDDDWESRIVGPWNPEIESPYEDHATPEQSALLQDFLERLAPYFELVDRAAEKREIAWPLRPAGAADTTVLPEFPHIPTLQSVYRFLAARATSARAEPERRRAIRTSIALGARLRARTLLEALVAVTGYCGGCRALGDALEDGCVDPSAARRDLDPELRGSWDARFPAIVRAERAWLIEQLPLWIDGTMQREMETRYGPGPSAMDRFARAVGELLKGRLPRDERHSASEMIEWMSGLGRYLDPELTAQATFRSGETEQLDAVAMLLPRVRMKLVEADALGGLARVALAAHEHRRVHGVWPAAPGDLARLFPEGVPLDPFTGAPFLLEQDGDALVLRAQPWDGIVDPGDDPAELGYVWRLPVR